MVLNVDNPVHVSLSHLVRTLHWICGKLWKRDWKVIVWCWLGDPEKRATSICGLVWFLLVIPRNVLSYSLSSTAVCYADFWVWSLSSVAFNQSVGLPWATASVYPCKIVLHNELCMTFSQGSCKLWTQVVYLDGRHIFLGLVDYRESTFYVFCSPSREWTKTFNVQIYWVLLLLSSSKGAR